MKKNRETINASSWGAMYPTQLKAVVFKNWTCVAVILSSILCLQPAGSVTLEAVTPQVGGPELIGPPEMKVWVSGVTAPDATLRLYRRIRPSATRPDFSIIVMPDTQCYTGVYGASSTPPVPEIFYNQTDWIVANRESRNIVFTAHVGDLIQTSGEVASEWEIAKSAMYRLENPMTTKLAAGIPYSIAVGNHDGTEYGYAGYNQHFGVSHFAGRPYYGGHHGADNTNHYSLFSSAGMDFIVLSLEFQAGSKAEVMAWANAVLSANLNRRAIVLSHQLLASGGNEWNFEGRKIYDAIKGNPNLFLMLCGHAPVFARRSDSYEGRVVTTVLSDYSNEPNGGNGWLRIMKFVPAKNEIQVQTYSPWLNQYKSSFGHEFTIPYDMTIPDPSFSLIGTVNVTSGGLIAGGFWADLMPGTSYDWYATVEEAGAVTRSATWTFTTGSNYSSTFYPIPSPELVPLKVAKFSKPQGEHPAIMWHSVGGQRYRVEYCNGGGSGMEFHEIVRSQAAETDPAPVGSASYQFFVDDGTLTGGASSSRFYRIREVP